MKTILLFLSFFSVSFFTMGQINDLFFSEYIEGSSFNKYLEIYNGTGADVDLSKYRILLYSNIIDTIPDRKHDLEGTLKKDSVVVFAHGSATIYSGLVITSTTCNFNGDDAVMLYNKVSGDTVDIIGRIGEDPGAAWKDGDYSTMDKTLVRKSTVMKGVTANPDTLFPTLTTEWVVYSKDSITFLGKHEVFIEPSLNLTSPYEGAIYYAGDTVKFEWEAVNVDTINFQLYIAKEGGWMPLEGMQNIDATLYEYDFRIPTDAEEGSYAIRIIDADNENLISESGLFNVIDTCFAGLYSSPFYPENRAANLYTDMENGTLMMSFRERIAIGDGSIYLRQKSDSAIVETFSLVNQNININEEDSFNVEMHLTMGPLNKQTTYFIEVDGNVIKDVATTSNYFEGFIGSDIWSFSTGDEAFEISIQEIQTPIDSSDSSPYVGNVVRTSGITTFVDEGGFYIQDGTSDYSGLYVNYNGVEEIGPWFSVTVIGTVSETDQMTQLENVSLLSHLAVDCDCTVEPVFVDLPFVEENESMLVTVSEIDSSESGPVDWRLFKQEQSGKMGSKYFLQDIPTCLDCLLSIAKATGVIVEENEELKIMPRNEFDVEVHVGIDKVMIGVDVIAISKDNVSVKSVIDIETVKLISLSGTVIVYNKDKGKEILIPGVKNLSGVYLIEVKLVNGEIVVQKIILK